MATQTDSNGLVVFNGRAVSYDRYRYELAIRNQATLKRVNEIASREARSVVSVARDFERQDLGGFLRRTVPALIDRYGNVNATAAMKYYDDARSAWLMTRKRSNQSRNSARTMATRVASAKLRGQIYKATMPKINPQELADPIIGYSMSLYAKNGFEGMVPELDNALTRAYASYHRNTILYNSALDDSVVAVQRVAQFGACEFCQIMAFRSNTQYSTGSLSDNVRTADYAIEFHDHCLCTIETLYEGDSPITPDYYSEFTYGKNLT